MEVTSLAELDEAIAAGAEAVLLDNMSVPRWPRRSGEQRAGCCWKASGGVALETVRAIAETGVDFISVGKLTHSAPALDLSLELAGD